MPQYVTKIKTSVGDLQIDYNALANLPDLKNMFSNPNLLINSDFRNPVNQRGKTSYVGTNETAIYTIDRWRTKCVTTTVNANSITLANKTTGAWAFGQYFEHALPEGMYTISVKVLSVSGSPYVRCTKSDGSYTAARTLSSTGVITTNAQGSLSNLLISMPASSSLEIEWIKLEYGSVATPFVPRLHDEELILCKRYYQYFDRTPIYGSSTSSITYFAPIQFCPSMRANPKKTLVKVLNGSAIEQSDVTLSQCVSTVYNIANVQLSKSIGQYGYVTIAFDAEIY